MTKFNYNQYCINRLLETFPELKDNERYRGDIEDGLRFESGAHDIFERVLCSYVLDMLNHKDFKDHAKMKKAFDLIENLINHEDFEVRCVAKVSFIEPFTCYMKPMQNVENYLEPKSLEMAREIAKERYGRNPITWEEE